MALSNLDKKTLTNLFEMISINENNKDKLLLSIKNDYLTYSKLKMIHAQINVLQNEANNVIELHKFNDEISNLECLFKKTPGTYIPVKNPKKIYSSKIDFLLILSWNLKKEIINQEKRFRINGGKFIIPFPNPKIIN